MLHTLIGCAGIPVKSDFTGVEKLAFSGDVGMGRVEGLFPHNPDGFFIDPDGMIGADETLIGMYDGILARPAVAFRGNVQHGVDQCATSHDLPPDGGCRFNELLLEQRHNMITAKNAALGLPLQETAMQGG
jgi:hypothetical protein